MTQQFAPPPGYRSVVPFNRKKHIGLAPRPEVPFGAELHAVYVTATEFPLAARYYPIVFVREPATEDFLPMAVTGLAARHNLFVDGNGQWQRDVYIPAYVRRYPFCIAQLLDDKGATDKTLICVDESALEPSAHPLIDARGESTSSWETMEKFLSDMEEARRLTNRLCRELEDLDLLETFEAQAYLKQGSQFHLKNMFRVTEERLRQVPGDVLEELVANSDLGRVYAHVLSLDNFKFLIDRAAARQSGAETGD